VYSAGSDRRFRESSRANIEVTGTGRRLSSTQAFMAPFDSFTTQRDGRHNTLSGTVPGVLTHSESPCSCKTRDASKSCATKLPKGFLQRLLKILAMLAHNWNCNHAHLANGPAL
jgi:hypothetical protein